MQKSACEPQTERTTVQPKNRKKTPKRMSRRARSSRPTETEALIHRAQESLQQSHLDLEIFKRLEHEFEDGKAAFDAEHSKTLISPRHETPDPSPSDSD